MPAEIDAFLEKITKYIEDLKGAFYSWSVGKVDDRVVSDKFVALGSNFNTIKASLEQRKLGKYVTIDFIPELRTVLEEALSLPPNLEVAQKYLPRINAIVMELIQQLKEALVQLTQQHQMTQQREHKSSYSQTHQQTISPRHVRIRGRAHQQSLPETPQNLTTQISASSETEHDALIQLQKQPALERRASRHMPRWHGSNNTSEQIPTTGVHQRFFTPDFTDSNVVDERGADTQSHSRTTHSKRRISTTINKSLSPNMVHGNRSVNVNKTEIMREETENKIDIHSANMLSVFLKLGSRIRKAKLAKPLSISAIRLKFIDVCEFSPSSEEVFPEISILDPKTGISYELSHDTISDINDGSLLALEVESEDSRTIFKELKELKQMIRDIKVTSVPRVMDKGGAVNLPVDRVSSKFGSPVLTGDGRFKIGNVSKSTQCTPDVLIELQKFTKENISQLRKEIDRLRSEARELADSNAHTIFNRRMVPESLNKFDVGLNHLISESEGLSDIIEDYRINISHHGVPIPFPELEKAKIKIDEWVSNIDNLARSISTENSVLDKIWRNELDNIVAEQGWWKRLRSSLEDLKTDKEQSMHVFDLVCKANGSQARIKSNRRDMILMVPPMAPGEEKSVVSAMLQEISDLKLNSEKRTEAMLKTERKQKVKVQMRAEEFELDLRSFVKNGMLKRNGGYEAMEKKRQEKEKETLKLALESEIEGMKLDSLVLEEKKIERKRQRDEKRIAAGLPATEKLEIAHDKLSHISESNSESLTKDDNDISDGGSANIKPDGMSVPKSYQKSDEARTESSNVEISDDKNKIESTTHSPILKPETIQSTPIYSSDAVVSDTPEIAQSKSSISATDKSTHRNEIDELSRSESPSLTEINNNVNFPDPSEFHISDSHLSEEDDVSTNILSPRKNYHSTPVPQMALDSEDEFLSL